MCPVRWNIKNQDHAVRPNRSGIEGFKPRKCLYLGLVEAKEGELERLG